ncbi:MAG: clan AA aspartic protease [Saprospiraceae bacterium]|nr:clan AA aspartic protease [Saprospiraceae bacterium]
MNPPSAKSEILPPKLSAMGYTAIALHQNIAGQQLIHAKINNVEGVYILDSGAGHTVVDSRQIETLKLDLRQEEAQFTGGGFGAHGIENVPSYGNKLEIGNFKMDNLVVAVMALDSAWESLAHIGAKEVLFGFIGVDVLKSGNALLDFSTMTLYLQNAHP